MLASRGLILFALLSLAVPGCGGSGKAPSSAEKSPPATDEANADTVSSTGGVEQDSSAIEDKLTAKPATDGGGIFDGSSASKATLIETKTLVEKYPDGKEKVRREVNIYSDNSVVNDGEFIDYYPDGKVFTKGAYNDGTHTGSWEYWHPNGKICRKVVYKDGKLDGQWEVFREDGTREYARGYQQGRRDGTWTYYDATGEKIVKIENYASDVPDGPWLHYYENGQKAIEEKYVKGQRNGKLAAWHKNGKKMAEESYRDGVLHGWRRAWDEEGNLIFEARFEEGRQVGSGSPAAPAAKPESAEK